MQNKMLEPVYKLSTLSHKLFCEDSKVEFSSNLLLSKESLSKSYASKELLDKLSPYVVLERVLNSIKVNVRQKINMVFTILLFCSFSNSLLAQEQPSLADRIQNEIPKDININKDIKTSMLVSDPHSILDRKGLRSIMFDGEQEVAVNAAIEALRNGALFSPNNEENSEDSNNTAINKKSYMYLASIMYVSSDYWAVWINGDKITSDNNLKTNEIYIEKIQRDKVSVLWTIGMSKWKILMGQKADEMQSKVNAQNQIEKRFEIRPNQTYLLLLNTVVEGNAENNSQIISKTLGKNPMEETQQTTNKMLNGQSPSN